MTDHFGIKDMWVVVKKNIYLILAALFLLLFVFGVINYRKLDVFGMENESRPLYASSASYYVKPNFENINCDKIDANYLRSLPDDYVSLITTDACENFISENLSKMYSSGYLEFNSDLTVTHGSDQISNQSIKKIYKVQRKNNTMVFDIYAFAYDKKLSDSILSLFQRYLKENVKDMVKNSSLEISGNAVKLVSSVKDVEVDAEPRTVENAPSTSRTLKIKSLLKNTIIPVVGLMALLLFILMLKAYFNPTLNRKSDFAQYDIPILGELKK